MQLAGTRRERLGKLTDENDVAIRIVKTHFTRGHVVGVGEVECLATPPVGTGLAMEVAAIMNALVEQKPAQARDVGAVHVEQHRLLRRIHRSIRTCQHELALAALQQRPERGPLGISHCVLRYKSHQCVEPQGCLDVGDVGEEHQPVDDTGRVRARWDVREHEPILATDAPAVDWSDFTGGVEVSVGLGRKASPPYRVPRLYDLLIESMAAFSYNAVNVMLEPANPPRDPAEPNRPDATELLDRIKREEAWGGVPGAGDGPARGKLKIFFGMAPGVGKTYAMLAAAQRMAAKGVDVVVGIVETHGRVETERMLLGLDILSRRKVVYPGVAIPDPGTSGDSSKSAVTLSEFDANAAILRRPDILLVDELAHNNAPGLARQKRWQDVQECLKAGINVYTTLNVQHLESINDVVAQITGVRVRETVPDAVFDDADEIELVDLPIEVLHERLRAGKVYLGEHAARAVDTRDGFFRKGNLTALRELALRRTAAWVDADLRRYKQDRGIRAVWSVAERIVVAVSPSPMSGKLIRAAKRMAAGLNAELIAVYVETPRTEFLSPADRDRLSRNFRLAEGLGATTTNLAGDNAARELLAFAPARDVRRIVVGKTDRPRWREVLFGSFIDNLIRESGDIDIYVVRGDDAGEAEAVAAPVAARAEASAGRGSSARRRATQAARFGSTCEIVGCASGLGLAVYQPPDLSEEALILLGGVALSALWLGRGPAVLGSVLSVLAFNFFFTEPRFSLYFNDRGYVVTFGVMLAIGLVVGTLAARTREQAGAARDRERRTAALYALSRELAAAQDARAVALVAVRHTHDLLGADVVVAVPVHGTSSAGLDVLAFGGSPEWFEDSGARGRERAVARWSIDHGKPAGIGTSMIPAAAGRYEPLVGTSGVLGTLGLRPNSGSKSNGRMGDFDAPSLLLTDALATQLASWLERVLLSDSQRASKLEAERERLRSALLSSVSHDLRTPLASMTGAASTLE